MPLAVLMPADGCTVHALGVCSSLQPLTMLFAAHRILRQLALVGGLLRFLTWSLTAYTASCPRPTTRCANPCHGDAIGAHSGAHEALWQV